MAKQGNSRNNKRSGIQPRMPKKPAGGMQSWMIIGLVIAMVSMFFFTKQRTLQEINQRQFESMVIQKEVESVVIVNDKLVCPPFGNYGLIVGNGNNGTNTLSVWLVSMTV
jgi:cell division protease FtsH